MAFLIFGMISTVAGCVLVALWHAMHLVFGVPPVSVDQGQGLVLGLVCLSQLSAGILTVVFD